MASPVVIREVRFLASTTFASNHSNAADTTWDNAPKLEVMEYDDSGLAREGLPDDTLKTRLYEEGAPTPGLSTGMVKLGTRGLGAYSNTDAHPAAILLNAVMGDIELPVTSRNVAVVSASTVVINIATCNDIMKPGMALLIGRKGDGRGNGEVKPIESCNAEAAVLGIACRAAPQANDPVVVSTTVFVNEDSPQSYIDTLAIGKATADQRQTIGGMGTVSFTGLGTSERPAMSMELSVADHQIVPVDNRATLQHAVAPAHCSPAFSKGIGSLQMGDYGSNTRTLFKYADFEHATGVSYTAIPGPGGVNGIEGWQKVKGKPTITTTLLFDEDMPGLETDFTTDPAQAKKILAQFGHEMGRCFAIEMGKAYVDGAPVSKAAGPLSGVGVTFHGSDDYDATSNAKSAAVKYHMF